MRAIQIERFGDPAQVLRVVDIEEPPPPGPHEVLVSVEATTHAARLAWCGFWRTGSYGSSPACRILQGLCAWMPPATVNTTSE